MAITREQVIAMKVDDLLAMIASADDPNFSEDALIHELAVSAGRKSTLTEMLQLGHFITAAAHKLAKWNAVQEARGHCP